MRTIFCILFCNFTTAIYAATDVTALLTSFQKTWDETKTYQASFKQTVESKQMGTKDESTGILYVEKPSKLRWESGTDGSVQILNGNQLTSIQINKRRSTKTVNILKDVSKTVDSKALSFLAGKAKFADLYNSKLLKENDKVASLKLTPQKGAPGESYVAEIDKKGYFLVSLTTEAPDSKVVMEFSEIKPNLKLDGKLFEYKADPKDIIRNQ